jgi:hypothetical protein
MSLMGRVPRCAASGFDRPVSCVYLPSIECRAPSSLFGISSQTPSLRAAVSLIRELEIDPQRQDASQRGRLRCRRDIARSRRRVTRGYEGSMNAKSRCDTKPGAVPR